VRRQRKRPHPLAGALLLGWLAAVGCNNPYRVGELVWVEWEEGKPNYPAYIVEKRGQNRYRVHFDGYDTRWDETVGLDRIKGRVEGPVNQPPPPPDCVAQAAGVNPQASGSAVPVSRYRPGDRVKVRWRDSTYAATVVEVVSSDRYRVHYDGYETAWDETVHSERIIGRR